MGANPVTIAPGYLCRLLRQTLTVVPLLGMATAANAQAPIVQPGAPGEAARELTAEEATDIAVTSHSPDDVRFLQDMIPHHNQAVQMAELVADRTNRPEVVDAAGRITLSQQDEMEFMERWLSDRGERLPTPSDHGAMRTDHRMAGMATPEQLAALAETEGTAFDRMFLQLMITHHEGAVTMVEELLDQPGSAYDPLLFEFTNDVTNDQTAEIERMHALLITLSEDPRAGLAAGFDDAGQALLHMELVASLPKPAGFFDPGNPAALPPERPRDDERTGIGAAAPEITTGTVTMLKDARSATRMTGVAVAQTGLRTTTGKAPKIAAIRRTATAAATRMMTAAGTTAMGRPTTRTRTANGTAIRC